MNLFASRLRQARTDNNLTQIALADLCGISRQTINNYESGIREPNLEVLNELSHLLNVSVDWLLGNDSSLSFSNNPTCFKERSVFCQRLISVRERKGETQAQVAAKLELSQGVYVNLESEKIVPDIVLVNKIAQYFDISIDWLLGKDTYIAPHKLVPRKYLQEPYGERLRQRIILLREFYCYKQEDVAHFLQLTLPEYQMFESGESDPPVAIMLGLSRLYQLPVESLTIENSYYVAEIKKRFQNIL